MSGLPDGTPAGAPESGSPRPTNSSGGVRDLPGSTGNSCYDQAAAPTSGERQVLSEDPFINSEAEAGDGHAPQKPPPSGSRTVRSVATGSAVGGPVQRNRYHLIDN
jgi:hypothetical protein